MKNGHVYGHDGGVMMNDSLDLQLRVESRLDAFEYFLKIMLDRFLIIRLVTIPEGSEAPTTTVT
jgi:hypothetical protein